MTFSTWIALALAWLTALALPGPDIFIILRLAVRDRKAAVLAAFGIMTGNIIWITATVLGITALLRAYPIIMPAIQVFGVVVLSYLGTQSVKSGLSELRQPTASEASLPRQNPWLLGLLTNMANPKALIFFTALLGQFIPPGSTWLTSLTIIIFMVLFGVAWFVGIALASSARAFRTWFKSAAPWFDIVAGSIFIIVAAIIAFEVTKTLAQLF